MYCTGIGRDNKNTRMYISETGAGRDRNEQTEEYCRQKRTGKEQGMMEIITPKYCRMRQV